MKALEVVSYISVPLIMVLGIYSMVTATGAGGGLAAVFSQSVGGFTLVTGIGFVIGSFISGGTATPNFIRFAKNNRIAVWTTVIAFFLGNTLMFCFGAVGGAFVKGAPAIINVGDSTFVQTSADTELQGVVCEVESAS